MANEDKAPQPLDLVKLATMLRRAAHAAYMATVGGGRSPQTGLFHDRMGEPRLGDLVAEISAYARDNSKDENAVGILISIMDQVEGMSRYKICTLDGRFVEWYDCQMVAFPADRPLSYNEETPV